MWIDEILETIRPTCPTCEKQCPTLQYAEIIKLSDLSDLSDPKRGYREYKKVHFEKNHTLDKANIEDCTPPLICKVNGEPIAEVHGSEDTPEEDDPLNYLNTRGVAVVDITEEGLHLVTDYSCSQELRDTIRFWTLGSFDKICERFECPEDMKKNVFVSSADMYELPKE